MMTTEISAARDVREGGLEHLTNAVEALQNDFRLLDQAIEGLMEMLRISFPAEKLGDAVTGEAPTRSIVEYVSREILALQRHSERQRKLIEWMREAIQ